MGYFNPPGWLVELGVVQRPPVEAPVTLAAPAPPAWLVVYATQMGAAERLAHETAAHIIQAGAAAELLSFDALSPARLACGQPTLMIASTSYEGDAPDMAEEFESLHMQTPAPLSGLHYGLLALGDRAYADFCGFGRRLHAWLMAGGAQPLFAPIEVDDEDLATLLAWQQCVIQQVHTRIQADLPSPRQHT